MKASAKQKARFAELRRETRSHANAPSAAHFRKLDNQPRSFGIFADVTRFYVAGTQRRGVCLPAF